MGSHLNCLNDACSAFFQSQQTHDSEVLENILGLLSPGQKRAVDRAIEGRTSGWLGVLPVACHRLGLSEVEFRDALALRYHRPLLRIPPQCDGCGAPFSPTHALVCQKGGLVTQCHNEIHDALGDLAATRFNEVLREPVMRESDDILGIPALIADLSVRGVWQPQTAASFNVRVVDTDAQSCLSHSVGAILSSGEQEKKRKYLEAVEARHVSFTLFVMSVDGFLGRESAHFLKRLADHLSSRWSKPYSEVMR